MEIVCSERQASDERQGVSLQNHKIVAKWVSRVAQDVAGDAAGDAPLPGGVAAIADSVCRNPFS